MEVCAPCAYDKGAETAQLELLDRFQWAVDVMATGSSGAFSPLQNWILNTREGIANAKKQAECDHEWSCHKCKKSYIPGILHPRKMK